MQAGFAARRQAKTAWIGCPSASLYGRPVRSIISFRGVEAEPPEKGGGQVGGGNGIGFGTGTELVAGADNGSAADTAAGQDNAVAVGPVIAAAGAIDPRAAAELAHGDDERRVEQAAIGQVVDQRRERQVGRREQVVLEPGEDVLMGVPVGELAVVLAIVNGDKPDARLDQPAGQKYTLAVLGAAVAVAEPGVFLVKVEGPADRRRSEQSERLVGVDVASRKRGLLVGRRSGASASWPASCRSSVCRRAAR